MDLRLHFLEARGTLAPWREPLGRQAFAVGQRIDALVPRARRHVADVVIRQSDHSIPELGLGGSCFEAGMVTIVLTPGNPTLEPSLRNGEFAATLAHELHHSLRHEGPGYGGTLAEAMVSEGLADRFAGEVTGCGRPIYTHLPEGEALRRLLDQAEAELASADYDHAAWFFGSDALPRWAGYGLGWRLVSRFLAAHPAESAASLVDAAADRVVGAAWAAMRAGDAADPQPRAARHASADSP